MSQNNILGPESDKELKFHSEIITDHRSVIWTIQNFSHCPTDVDEYLQSPEFTTRSPSIATWTLRVYPKGHKECNSVGKVGLFLHKAMSDTEVHDVQYKLCLKDRYGKDRYLVQSEQLFKGNGTSWGRGSVVDREVLLGVEREELLFEDTLRVYCEITVGCFDSSVSSSEPPLKGENSLSSPAVACLDTLSINLDRLLKTEKWSDFNLQSGDRVFPVHKAILAARSTVFAAMLEHDMHESRNHCACIPDLDDATLEDMLAYIYSGTVRVLTTNKALKLFAAADKYNLDELKGTCKKFLMDHMSVDCVCDVAVMADLHDEVELKEATKEFVCRNTSKVLSSNGWEVLLKDNPQMASQLLEVMTSGYANKT